MNDRDVAFAQIEERERQSRMQDWRHEAAYRLLHKVKAIQDDPVNAALQIVRYMPDDEIKELERLLSRVTQRGFADW